MNRSPFLASLAALTAVGVAGCGGSDALDEDTTSGESTDSGTIVVGSANFPENVLLAEIYAGALEGAGVKTQVKPNIGSREVCLKALTGDSPSLDVMPEYTGNLRLYFDESATASDPEGVYKELQAALPEDLTVLDYAEAQDKDAVVVTRETADKYSLTEIGDLAAVGSKLKLGGPSEWKTRSTGVPGLEKVYGVRFADFVELDAGGPLSLNALLDGRVDAANLFTTDPNVASEDLVVLEDPKSLFAAQNVVPLLRTEVVTDDVTKSLDEVSAALDTDTLATLVSRVVSDKEDPEDVAADFLTEQGLD